MYIHMYVDIYMVCHQWWAPITPIRPLPGGAPP